MADILYVRFCITFVTILYELQQYNLIMIRIYGKGNNGSLIHIGQICI